MNHKTIIQPRWPIFIPSKGRAESRLTIKVLQSYGIENWWVIVEEQERDLYLPHVGEKHLLILPRQYQIDYDTCDDWGIETMGPGAGAPRNFAWDVAQHHLNAAWHWTMDDNISWFGYLLNNHIHKFIDASGIAIIEKHATLYRNVGMAGPQYEMFLPSGKACPPLTLNTRIFSCNLIRTAVPLRWRCRYNEDDVLSMDMLMRGWCTILNNRVCQKKMTTQKMKGGNTDTLYKDGTKAKSAHLYRLFPEHVELVERYGRHHHRLNFASLFSHLKLVHDDGVQFEPIPLTLIDAPSSPKPDKDVARISITSSAESRQSYKKPLEYLEDIRNACMLCGIDADAAMHAIATWQVDGVLYNRWYASIAAGKPDYGIYDSLEYIGEAFGCWREYSFDTIMKLTKPTKILPQGLISTLRGIETVIDLGCGLGLTTRELASLFRSAQVFGTNVKGSYQWRIGEVLSSSGRFTLCGGEEVASLNRRGLVFASEYFEHFEDPIRELHRVLATEPRYLVCANTFCNAGAGHFPQYNISGKIATGKETGRAFGTAMRTAGFTSVTTGFWNSRPAVWVYNQT